MDDDSGWNQVLLELWNPAVCRAVVERIETAARGRHGWLVRVFSDPDRVRGELTETVHALVIAAIRDETGANLDELGSQAAWHCYEQVWICLSTRWADGGELAVVPLTAEPSVVDALAQLPPEAAVAAGADVDVDGIQPLWLHGRLRIDVQGLRTYLALDGGQAPDPIAATIRHILGHVG